MAAAAMTIKTFPTDKFNDDYPPDPPGREIDKYSRIWRVYRDKRRKSELDRVGGWNKLFDILLTFAGLFIAALTVFLVDSYKLLQEDSTDYIAELLFNITASAPVTHATGNVTRPRSDPSDPSPSRFLLWTNVLWFSSLLVTLVVALYCILAKQWIREYERTIRAGTTTSHEWTKQQVMAWERMKRWGVPVLVSLLPTLIHASLFLFLLGLCLRLIEIDKPITILVAAAGGGVLLAYILQTLISLFIKSCAWRTSLTRRLSDLFSATRPPTSIVQRVIAALPWTGYEIRDDNAEAYAIRWLILSCDLNAAAVATQAIAAAAGPPYEYEQGFHSGFHNHAPMQQPSLAWQHGRAAGIAAAAAPMVPAAPAGLNALAQLGEGAGRAAGWAGYIRAATAGPGAGDTRDAVNDVHAGHAAGRAARFFVQGVRPAVGANAVQVAHLAQQAAGKAAGYAAYQVGVATAKASAPTTVITTATAIGATLSTTTARTGTIPGTPTDNDPNAMPSPRYLAAYDTGYDSRNVAANNAPEVDTPLRHEILTYLQRYKPEDLRIRLRSRIAEISAYPFQIHPPAEAELEYCERGLQGLP